LSKSLQKAGITEADLKADKKIDFGKELDTEAKAWKTIWSAGQGVTSISDSPSVTQLIERLQSEFKTALLNQQKQFHQWFD